MSDPGLQPIRPRLCPSFRFLNLVARPTSPIAPIAAFGRNQSSDDDSHPRHQGTAEACEKSAADLPQRQLTGRQSRALCARARARPGRLDLSRLTTGPAFASFSPELAPGVPVAAFVVANQRAILPERESRESSVQSRADVTRTAQVLGVIQ
jgi:hypothetical protein